jgi:hypothetical protein
MSSPDFTWLVEHSPEVFEKYAGKWIAVHDGEVIGVGDTATEAVERARAKVPEGEFILEGVDGEGDVVYSSV